MTQWKANISASPKVDLDDPQDLFDWAKKKGRWADRRTGGHPYEIFARTYLFPHYTDGYNGYYTWRGFIWNYNECVQFCREPNVLLIDREHIVRIINCEDNIQVTPDVTPHGYPNKKYSQSVSYGSLTRKQKAKVIWDELAEAQIKIG